MRKSHIELPDVTLQLIDNLLNGAPFCDVGSLESHELSLRVKDFTLLNDKLRLIDVGLGAAYVIWIVIE